MKIVTKPSDYTRLHQVMVTIREEMQSVPMHDWKYFDIEIDICERVEDNLSLMKSLGYQEINSRPDFVTYRITKI